MLTLGVLSALVASGTSQIVSASALPAVSRAADSSHMVAAPFAGAWDRLWTSRPEGASDLPATARRPAALLGGTANDNVLAAALKYAATHPTDPTAWLNVGNAAYNVAQLPGNYVPNHGYTSAGRAALAELRLAWIKYLWLKPLTPDLRLAEIVASVFGSKPPTGVGDYALAETAQEIVAKSDPTYEQYADLAFVSYRAHDYPDGDVAAVGAVALAPAALRPALKRQLAAVRRQAERGAG